MNYASKRMWRFIAFLIGGVSALTFSLSNARAVDLAGTISFDHYADAQDNDYRYYFDLSVWSRGELFTQTTTGGISGGGLQPIPYIEWGNQAANLRYAFVPADNATLNVSVDFYFSPALVNGNYPQRPVSIFLFPSSDPNHYVMSYIEDAAIGPFLQTFTFAWVSSNDGFSRLNLSEGWYRIALKVTVKNQSFGELEILDSLYSLGGDGLQTPVSLQDTQKVIYDPVFTRSSSVAIWLSAASWGGARLLDNFSFSGPMIDVVAIQDAIKDAKRKAKLRKIAAKKRALNKVQHVQASPAVLMERIKRLKAELKKLRKELQALEKSK